MAPVRGDGMRGLAVFISDIRNCKYIHIHNNCFVQQHISQCVSICNFTHYVYIEYEEVNNFFTFDTFLCNPRGYHRCGQQMESDYMADYRR